jgi:Holliday junction resolvasome RuvABC endonuclease subunit
MVGINMPNVKITAIDPGKNGGVAIYTPGMVTAARILSDMFMVELLRHCSNHIVVIEDVGYHVKGNNAQASATFARHVGWLLGAAAALEIGVSIVTPKTWQAALLGKAKHETKAHRKNAIKARVQSLYPHIKVTLATADALGILTWALAEYGDRNDR